MPFNTAFFRPLPLALALQAALCGVSQAADFSVGSGSTDTTAKALTSGNTGSVASGGTLQGNGSAVNISITGTSGSVTLNNQGSISNTGTARAIDNNTDGVSIVINNDGSISTVGGDAVRLNKANTALIVNNNGTIAVTGSGTSGGQALDLRGANGTGSKVINNGSASNSSARIESSNDDALRPGSNTTINNYGTITSTGVVNTKCPDNLQSRCDTANGGGKAASANDAIDSEKAVTVNNWGNIVGPRHGLTSDAGVTVNNYASGQIIGHNGSGVGSDGVGSVINHGLISGRYAGAGNAFDHFGDGTTSNNGDGDGVDIDGIASISNYGRIEGLGAGGVDSGGFPNGADGIAAGGGTITNYAGASIFGQSKGILIDDGANGSAVASGRGTATTVGGAASISNAGSIIGANSTAIGLVGDFADSLSNLSGGVIRGGLHSMRVDQLGSTSAAAAVQMGAGNDNLNNQGLIEGLNGLAVDLGTGDDQLTVLSGGRFIGLVDGGAGHDNLYLEGALGGIFGNSQNLETLEVRSGAWTVSSPDFSAGGAVLSGAELINQGRIGGTLQVNSGGTYSGGGRLHNLQLDAGSTLAFAVAANGSHSPVLADGTAQIGGAHLAIRAGAGDHSLQREYRVLSASSVSGEFASVSSNFAFLTPTLRYSADAVDLELTRNDVSLASVATSSSAANVAGQIDQNSSPELYNALITSNSSTASQALEQLAGAANASMASATLAGASQVGGAMQGAMAQLGGFSNSLQASILREDGPQLVATGLPSGARNLHDPQAAGRLWVQGLGSHGRVDGEDGGSDVTQDSLGSLLGADWALSPDWRLGLLGGYSRADMDAGNGASGDIDSLHIGAYALHQRGPLALRLGAAYSRHDGQSKRRVDFNGFSDAPRGDYDADSQQAFAELGYQLTHGRLLAEPFANLGYQRYSRDAYREKGGAAALQVESQEQDNLSSTFGVRVAHLGQLANGMSVTPRLSLGWRHTFGDLDSSTQQALLSGGSAFSASGSALDRNSLLLEAGVDVGISATQSLGLGYSGELGNNAQNHGLIAQWQLGF
jgi:outer membrane autotransporter protein